jgi:hypothetical protein
MEEMAELGRWGDGEMGRWGDGEMGRWGDGTPTPHLHTPTTPSSYHLVIVSPPLPTVI